MKNKKIITVSLIGLIGVLLSMFIISYFLNDYGMPSNNFFTQKTVEFYKVNGTMGRPSSYDYVRSEMYQNSQNSFIGKKEVACYTLSNNKIIHSDSEIFRNCRINPDDYVRNYVIDFGQVDYETKDVVVKSIKKKNGGKVVEVTSDLTLIEYLTSLLGTDTSSKGDVRQTAKTFEVKDVIIEFRYDEKEKDWKVFSSPNLASKTKQFMSTWDYSSEIIDTKDLKKEIVKEYLPEYGS